VPSTELIIREARRSPGTLSPANEALVFGIYFSAVVSLEPEEVCIVQKIGISHVDVVNPCFPRS
jgi:hypothetical protein